MGPGVPRRVHPPIRAVAVLRVAAELVVVRVLPAHADLDASKHGEQVSFWTLRRAHKTRLDTRLSDIDSLRYVFPIQAQ